ncbi:class I SAM-dependent methyltransferase [Synechococcus sp. A10-1-5-1]|uniref:class I SAM-dependent methyltransferase n=1 Tax=Synechococcus sp. A10-1-5-1 TaxID=2936507 RepID=UPI0035302896
MANNRGFQTIYSPSHLTKYFDGWWDPLALLSLLDLSLSSAGEDPHTFWYGKSILDIGSNTCGLSVELARRGAKVHCVEPDDRAHVIYSNTMNLLSVESLQIELTKGTLEDCLNSGRSYDVVLFLGLLYHFKYPEYVISAIASKIPHNTLFISTQCTHLEGLVSVNRLQEMPERLRKTMNHLTGWHLSRQLLKQILVDLGYTQIHEGSDPSVSFLNKPKDVTNSTYLYAHKDSKVTPFDTQSELLKYYPR